jgi:DNA (cytosine-5)-methyltransferase 1
MKHLGDISKINGAEIDPVDIISFGSPCQDLSIAGRRAGLEGGRSSLFMQAVRIIREMRKATNGIYPARIVWENVPGAFTTHKGRDFQKVIEEIARIAEPELSIPRPAKRGGWLASGSVLGDRWSLAWRVLDSQYWGVPQRRRRIFLVCDFRTRRAGEILFKPESETGDIAKGRTTGAGNTGDVEKRVEQYVVDDGYSSSRIQINPEIAVTLKASSGGCGAKTGLYFLPTYCVVGNTIDRSAKSGGNGSGVSEEICYTLNTTDRHAVTVPFIRNAFGDYKQGEVGRTICVKDDITSGDLIASHYSVRRLTPLECERLQGYPDRWTEIGHDGKRISDNQRYKALGNSLAIPCAVFVLSRMKN